MSVGRPRCTFHSFGNTHLFAAYAVTYCYSIIVRKQVRHRCEIVARQMEKINIKKIKLKLKKQGKNAAQIDNLSWHACKLNPWVFIVKPSERKTKRWILMWKPWPLCIGEHDRVTGRAELPTETILWQIEIHKTFTWTRFYVEYMANTFTLQDSPHSTIKFICVYTLHRHGPRQNWHQRNCTFTGFKILIKETRLAECFIQAKESTCSCDRKQ